MYQVGIYVFLRFFGNIVSYFGFTFMESKIVIEINPRLNNILFNSIDENVFNQS